MTNTEPDGVLSAVYNAVTRRLNLQVKAHVAVTDPPPASTAMAGAGVWAAVFDSEALALNIVEVR